MKKERVIIVGAGMAGLTAAAYLAKDDYEVTLIDKNEKVGGLVNTFEREGFSFDTGPRAFVNSGMVKPILKDLGIELETFSNRIAIAIEDKIINVESLDNIDDYKNMMIELFPEDKNDIEKIMKVISKLSKSTAVLYELDNPSFTDFSKDRIKLLSKLIPWSFRFLFALFKFSRYNTPMEDYLNTITDNQSIVDILTQFFFSKTPTHFALGYFYVYLDYFYPKGGTESLPKHILEKVVDYGAELKTNTRITQVNPDKKDIMDDKGNIYKYDHLIWAADLKALYKLSDISNLNENEIAKIRKQAELISEAKPAESVFVTYYGVDLPTSYFKERGGEHFFYTPSKFGLGSINKKDKNYIIDNFSSLSKDDIYKWANDFCMMNTFEVSIPALRDGNLAPEGKTGVMISFLFEFKIIELIEEAGWTDEFKGYIEDLVVSIFSKTYFEGFGEKVLFKLSTTPKSILNLSGNTAGSIVGWSFETKIPVYSRIMDLPKSVLTPIPNVYKASQWTYSPSGVPIAMITGWYASKAVIEKK